MRLLRSLRFLAMTMGLAITLFLTSSSSAKEVMLQKAWTHYLEGDYEKAVGVCRRISKGKALGEDGYYIMGISFLKLGRPQEARKNFRFVLENYRKTTRRQELVLGVADSYYLEGEWGRAEEYYIRLLKTFPGTEYASIAYLRLGECQRKQGLWQASKSSFNKIVRDLPLSLESRRAREYLEMKASFFSVQVGAFSKRKNAENLSRRLRKKGYDAYIEKTYKQDSIIYRVKVGRFDRKEEAIKKAERLKKEGLTTRITA